MKAPPAVRVLVLLLVLIGVVVLVGPRLYRRVKTPAVPAGAAAPVSQGPPRPLRLAPGRSHFLVRDTPRDTVGDTHVWRLEPDGRYERWEVGSRDHGAWSQGEDGLLRVVSAVNHAHFATRVAYVPLLWPSLIRSLPRIKQGLSALLEGSPTKSVFTRQEVLRAAFALDRGCPPPRGTLGLFPGVASLTREEVQSLVSELESYIRAPRGRTEIFRVYQLGSKVCLMDGAPSASDGQAISRWPDRHCFAAVERAAYDRASLRNAHDFPQQAPAWTEKPPARVEARLEPLPAGRSHFFHDGSRRGLELKADGTWREIASGSEVDSGRWRSREEGRLELSSEARRAPISLGPLRVDPMRRDLADLRALRAGLLELQQKDRREVLTRTEVAELASVPMPPGQAGPAVTLSGMVTECRRDDLVKLLAAVDAYLARPPWYAVTFKPYRVGKRLVLVDDRNGVSDLEVACPSPIDQPLAAVDEAIFRSRIAEAEPQRGTSRFE